MSTIPTHSDGAGNLAETGDRRRRLSSHLAAAAVIVTSAVSRASLLLVVLAIAGSHQIGQTARASFVNVPIVQLKTLAVSSADITNLVASPIEVLPAPGAGRINVVMGCALTYTHGGVTYVNPGGTSSLGYTTSGAGTNVCGIASNLNSFFTSAASVTYGTNPTGFATFPPANTAIRLQKNGSEFTTGNGTVFIALLYAVLPTQ